MPLDPCDQGARRLREAIIDAYTYKGKLYGFPIWKLWNVSANQAPRRGLDRLEEDQKGLRPAVEVAKKLTKEQASRQAVGVRVPRHLVERRLPEMWMLWNANSGMLYPVDEQGKLLYNDPRALDNLRRIISYSKDHKVSPENNAAFETAKVTELFNNWETAMIARSGPYIVPQQKTRCDNIKAGRSRARVSRPVMLHSHT
jgi:ABC-type glycerol-3-phosphate transport system substrate-binding protein